MCRADARWAGEPTPASQMSHHHSHRSPDNVRPQSRPQSYISRTHHRHARLSFLQSSIHLPSVHCQRPPQQATPASPASQRTGHMAPHISPLQATQVPKPVHARSSSHQQAASKFAKKKRKKKKTWHNIYLHLFPNHILKLYEPPHFHVQPHPHDGNNTDTRQH